MTCFKGGPLYSKTPVSAAADANERPVKAALRTNDSAVATAEKKALAQHSMTIVRSATA